MTRPDQPGEAVTIRLLGRADLAEVARVHLAAFPKAAITRMGPAATRRYYDSLMTGPHEIVPLGAFAGGELAGYCFGGVFRGAEVFYLRRNAGFLAWRLLTRPWLLNDSFFRDRVRTAVRITTRLTRRRPRANPLAPPLEVLSHSFGIQSIAVDPRFRGRGIAKRLLEASEAAARERSFRAMDLSVHVDNAPAVGLYVTMGWQKHLAGGVWHGYMFRHLD